MSNERIISKSKFFESAIMICIAKINGVYDKYLGEVKPARACVEVARLPKDVKVEIGVIAVK